MLILGNSIPQNGIYVEHDSLKATNPNLVMACYGMNDAIYSAKDDTRFNNYKAYV